MKHIVIIACCTLFFASCTSIFKTTTYKTSDVNGVGVIQNPVLVDLDVQEAKIEATVNAKRGSSIEAVKEEAIIKAVKLAQADVLVEPQFDVESSKAGVTVTVKGFPAHYKNFRSAKPEDMALLKSKSSRQANVYKSTTNENKITRKADRGTKVALVTILGFSVAAAVTILTFTIFEL